MEIETTNLFSVDSSSRHAIHTSSGRWAFVWSGGERFEVLFETKNKLSILFFPTFSKALSVTIDCNTSPIMYETGLQSMRPIQRIRTGARYARTEIFQLKHNARPDEW